MNARFPLIAIPLVLFIITSILVYFGIINTWFGEPREGIMLFCEHARDGFIKQPANSFSNLAFSFVGLFIAWFTYKSKFHKTNPMSEGFFYPLVLSSSLIILGAGSFAMHASNGFWGGFSDLFGMFLLSSFIFSYALMRWFKLSKSLFLIIYLSNVAFSTYVLLSPWNKTEWLLNYSEFCFAFHLIFAAIIEICLLFFRKNNIQSSLGWISLSTVIISFIIWNLSRTQDSFWCDPHSLIQGHALWHILDALAVYFLFRFYISEDRE